MKKSFIFGAALFACALGFQSCSDVDKPVPTDEPLVAEIKAGTDLAVLADKYAEDGVLTLPAGAEVTLKDAFEVPAALTIVGDEAQPAKVKLTGEKAGFVIANNLVLKNLEFDCAASKEAFIKFSTNPDAEPITVNAWNVDYNFYLIDDIEIVNCKLDNVNSFVLTDVKFGDNGVWFAENILVDNSIVHLTTTANNTNNAYFYINNGGGYAKELTVKNSTFYNTTDFGFRYFVRYGGFGQTNTEEPLGWKDNTITYENNTFYNVCQNDGQWGNYNGIYRATTSNFIMKSNIFWNCSTSGSVPRRFLQGRGWGADATNVVFLNNTYMKKEVDEEGNATFQDPQNYDVSGTDIKEDPKFADPANADFHISGAKQVELKTGDPRWL